jgi:hypothetical protein
MYKLVVVRQPPLHKHIQGIDGMVTLIGFKVFNLDVSVRRSEQKSLSLV